MDPLMIAVMHAVGHKASQYMTEEEIEFRWWKKSGSLNSSMLRGTSIWGAEYDLR